MKKLTSLTGFKYDFMISVTAFWRNKRRKYWLTFWSYWNL